MNNVSFEWKNNSNMTTQVPKWTWFDHPEGMSLKRLSDLSPSTQMSVSAMEYTKGICAAFLWKSGRVIVCEITLKKKKKKSHTKTHLLNTWAAYMDVTINFSWSP